MDEFVKSEANWPALHSIYQQGRANLQARSGGNMDITTALNLASAEMGECMEPRMTGREFREWDTENMRRLQTAKRVERQAQFVNKHPEAGQRRPSWAQERLEAALPALRPEPEEPELGLGQRALLLLKGMAHGEVRFEVCVSKEHATDFQSRLSHAATSTLNWKPGGFTSTVLKDEVHQAGEKRVLVMVLRQ